MYLVLAYCYHWPPALIVRVICFGSVSLEEFFFFVVV